MTGFKKCLVERIRENTIGKRTLLLAMVLVVLPAMMGLAAQTVRVDTSTAAPRLLVDGRPVRARMFWGAPGSGLLPVGPQGERITFEFSPAEDEPSAATMHFRFGHTPGTICLDDIQVMEIETAQDVIPRQEYEQGIDDFTQRWSIWPPGPQNTVGTVEVKPGCGSDRSGGLQVDLKAPADGQWPDFHIYHNPGLKLRKGRRYRVSLWARAEPARNLTIAFYRPGQTYVFLGGPPGPFAQQIKLAADVGVDFVSFPVSLPWPRPGQSVDWSAVDAQCQRVLDANSHALLLPRIGMAPPAWWRQAHPDDVMVWDTGPQKHVGFVVASPEYRRDAAERLAILVNHLEEKFGRSMAGYHPCGQNTGEWFYQETWGQALNGYSEGGLRAWRSWLKQQYTDDRALQAAWQDARITRQTADVPSPAARRRAPAGVLRHPASERPLIDFARFQQEMMGDCVCCLARAVRKATGGRKLVVFFYGYVFEFGAIRNGPATSGHYCLRRVLDSPDIDVLCSPISYFDRGLGQSAPAMTAAESVALAGKMWLYEDDTRTYLGTGRFPGWQDRVNTLEETNRELLRNTAQCALRNFGTWWMDLGATGWFNDSRMWGEMDRLKALDEPLLEKPLPFQPEVAAVIDEQSMIGVAAGGDIMTRPGVYEVRRPLGRMGAPYGQYLLDDVAAGRAQAKMYVFLTAWSLTADQGERLLAATRGGLRIWCYAPGYYQGDRASLEAMWRLTGFQMRKLTDVSAWAEPTRAGRALGLRESFGVKKPIEPLFAAADASPEETLATYPDGSAAVALRRTEDGLSLFVGAIGLTSELLRAASRKAGVHLFTDSDCNVYANGPYMALHASQDGPVELNTGQSGAVVDFLSGEQLGPGPRVTLPMKRGDTRVLGVINPE